MHDKYVKRDIRFHCNFWQSAPKSLEYIDNIGSLDIETCAQRISPGLCKSWAYYVGAKLNNGEVILEHLQPRERLEDNGPLIRLLDRLLSDKRCHNTVFWTHNLGGFDSRFILDALGKMDESYKTRVRGKDMNNIFRIEVSKKIKGMTIKIIIADSYRILPQKLSTLGKAFKVDNQKGVFPYSFVTNENLFYEGSIPEYRYYENQLTREEYYEHKAKYSMPGRPWSVMKETLYYITKDLNCLVDVMKTFSEVIFNDFGVNVSKTSSYSSLSKLVYLSNYYNYKFKIPVISGYVEDFIRQGYYGGVVDLYGHILSMAYKYDANSCYPAAMKNPMPVGNPVVTDNKNLDQLFGFVYAKVKAPCEKDLAIPILPVKGSDGELHCPRGKFEGVYFTEELKNAKKYGYKVEVVAAVVFDKGLSLFDEFVDELYKRKAAAKEEGDSVKELIYKLILNSFYGKSAQKEITNTFAFIAKQELGKYELMHSLDLTQEFGSKVLVRSKGKIDLDIAEIIKAGCMDQQSQSDPEIVDNCVKKKLADGVYDTPSMAKVPSRKQ